jgi:chemotaxis protein MotB
VVGMASSLLLEPNDPLNPINRRISILVMTKEAEERLLGSQAAAVEAAPPGGPAPTVSATNSPP